MSNSVTDSVIFGADLEKGTPVRLSAEGDAKLLSGHGSGSIGIVNYGGASGSLGSVTLCGPAKAQTSDSTIKKFDKLTFDATGVVVKLSGSNICNAVAMEDGRAAVGGVNSFILVNVLAAGGHKLD